MSDTSTRHLLGERVLVADGAIGTMLHSAGVPVDLPVSLVNRSRPELVRDLHRAYVAAGADMIQTNTFDANRRRLGAVGSADAVAAINVAGARLAREAAREASRTILVAGSIGPVLRSTDEGRIALAQRASVLAEQIAALASWVDLLVLETFGDLESLLQAIDVALRESDLPVIAQMTFSTNGRTLRGEDPATVAAALSAKNVAAVGANCTVGPSSLREVISEMVAHTTLPVTVHPNAGMPERFGQQLQYAHNVEYFAEEAVGFVLNGARVVGGCCGTTPAHVRAISEATRALVPSPLPRTDQRPAAAFALPQTGAVVDDPPRWPRAEQFSVLAAVRVPTGGNLDELVALTHELSAAGISMISVADPEPPAARVNPIATGVLLHERVGVDVILTIETADRTLAALQADLLGAHALGLDIVLCRTGTPRVTGDYPRAGTMWDVDALQLVRTLSGLNEGVDWRGVSVPERTRFVIGTVIHTNASDEQAAIDAAVEKVRAGAHFLLTDPVFDVATTSEVLSALKTQVDVPVLASLPDLGAGAPTARSVHEMPSTARSSAARELADRVARDPDEARRHALLTVQKLTGLVAGVQLHATPPTRGWLLDVVPALRSAVEPS